MEREQERLEEYFKKYCPLVFRVAFAEVKSHADAEDVLQETFIKLLRYHPVFENEEHEKAWLIRTAINLSKDLLKSKWQQVTVGMDEDFHEEKTYMKVPYLEEDETLWRVLALSEKYRQPLYLFYYEDYSIKEIARALDMPEATVKTNLRRGREILKADLERSR